MMTGKLLRFCLGVFFFVSATATVNAQDTVLDPSLLRPDPNNAVIEGRVVLPSGRSADINIKITLSNSQSTLTTFFTDKHGEFRFLNLSAGIYYVQAAGDPNLYEPVTATVRLARSQVVNLTLTLRRKEETVSRYSGAQVVSISEVNQQVPQAARKEYEQGVKLAGKGKLQQAIEHFQQAVAIYPDYLIARNDLGAQYLKLKRLDEAAEHFRIALRKNPEYYNSRFNLGLVMVEQKNYADAIAQLNQAIAIDSSQPAAHLWLGIALLQAGELPGAEHELAKALIMGSPNFAVAHFHLAQVYLRRGDSAEATRALKAYLGDSPKGEFAEQARRLLKELEAANHPAAKPR